MSISGNYFGWPEYPVPVRLTTVAITDVFLAANKSSTIGSVLVANETGAAANIIITYFDGTTNFAVWRKPVPANDSVVLENFPIRLKTGDKIKATASVANALTVSCNVIKSHSNEIARNPLGTGRF